MKLSLLGRLALVASSVFVLDVSGVELTSHRHHEKKHHVRHGRHGHHKAHHHHHSPRNASNSSGTAASPAVAQNASTAAVSNKTQSAVKKANASLISAASQQLKQPSQIVRGRILMNGPLPMDFDGHFTKAISIATGSQETDVKIVSTTYTDSSQKIVEVDFEGPVGVIHSVEDQAADPYSHLSNGELRPFLVAHDASFLDVSSGSNAAAAAGAASGNGKCAQPPCEEEVEAPAPPAPEECPAPCASAIDIDTEMPYGDLEPFGREDTAQELTESSISESNEMVDQLERAEVAEEKRAVFRALTRLRGAAITSFDGIARSQTGNIDEYNKVHKWRMTHPLRHLADEESDITKWAFPDNADF